MTEQEHLCINVLYGSIQKAVVGSKRKSLEVNP